MSRTDFAAGPAPHCITDVDGKVVGPASTAAHSNPTINSATSTQVLAVDADRRKYFFQNTTAFDIALNFAGEAITSMTPGSSNKIILLKPGAAWESPSEQIATQAVTARQESGAATNGLSIMTVSY